MAGPKGRKGMVNKRFGKTGRPVEVSAKLAARHRMGEIRLYEDGNFTTLARKKLGGNKAL